MTHAEGWTVMTALPTGPRSDWPMFKYAKDSMSDQPKPPIKSGWRGNLSGAVEHTTSTILVSEVTLRLDAETAWALANLLHDAAIARSMAAEGSQVTALSTLGAALGRLIDHPAANNGGPASNEQAG